MIIRLLFTYFAIKIRLTMTFDFVNDEEIKQLLRRDYAELEKCFETKASKSVLILSGSILEAVLIDYFTSNISDAEEITRLYKESLGGLIERANYEKIIGNNNKNFSSGIQGYRNLIHPGREVRLKEKFDFDTASLSFSALKLILKEVENKSLSSKGRTADEIFAKLKNEGFTEGLFIKISNKLNKTERTKLFVLLITEDTNDDGFCLVKDPFLFAKNLLDSLDLKTYDFFAKEIMKEIESGSKEKALKYCKYFYTRLAQLLTEKDLDIVLELLLDEASAKISSPEGMRFLGVNKVFEGIFFNKKDFENTWLRNIAGLLSFYFQKYDDSYLYMDSWTIFHANLEEDTYNRLVEYLGRNSDGKHFISCYDNGEYLPF
jgi:hypothetical protein